jgi:hypothetical protein
VFATNEVHTKCHITVCRCISRGPRRDAGVRPGYAAGGELVCSALRLTKHVFVEANAGQFRQHSLDHFKAGWRQHTTVTSRRDTSRRVLWSRTIARRNSPWTRRWSSGPKAALSATNRGAPASGSGSIPPAGFSTIRAATKFRSSERTETTASPPMAISVGCCNSKPRQKTPGSNPRLQPE